MDQTTDIGISYQEDVPKTLIEGFERVLISGGLEVELHERPIGTFASLEWAIPTLIIAYIAKPYFDGFLSEAGKDHYTALRNGILKISQRLFSSENGREYRRVSTVFSVQSVCVNDVSVKFVFPEGLKQNQYEDLVEKMHELLTQHHTKSGTDQLSQLIAPTMARSRSYFLEFSLARNEWIMIDPQVEAKLLHEKQQIKNSTQDT